MDKNDVITICNTINTEAKNLKSYNDGKSFIIINKLSNKVILTFEIDENQS